MTWLCSCRNNNIENRAYQKELLNIETFYKIAQKRISFLDPFISELQVKDSLLSIVIFEPQNFTNVFENKKANDSHMNESINTIIKEPYCKNKQKKELSILLRKLKVSEIKCDTNLTLLYHFTQRDSIYREKLGLEFFPYEILLKTKKANESQEELIKEYDYAKQLDIKINKITFLTYYITHSHDEIIKAIEEEQNKL